MRTGRITDKEFLHRRPERRIQCLLGSEDPTPGHNMTPSHDNIVRMLHSLIDNQEIDPGDNMLIYFSGHGACYYCSENFLISECDNNICPIEALCPLDRDTVDAKGCYVPESATESSTLFSQRFLRSMGIRLHLSQTGVTLAVLAAIAKTWECAAYIQILIPMSEMC
ncbi:hypothetical protein ARMGADRAFT_1071119 [Armillaria gallica]|uniref:Peptidase C14 n=1 Tax=Armillaria gallica TaxID=47427 RepID=A0A2H3E5F3_ARMGA|nr:hypothetical protein ARMGADRAFT_1071119 [Armillaria gallica]